jgi:hypothetical protein
MFCSVIARMLATGNGSSISRVSGLRRSLLLWSWVRVERDIKPGKERNQAAGPGNWGRVRADRDLSSTTIQQWRIL